MLTVIAIVISGAVGGILYFTQSINSVLVYILLELIMLFSIVCLELSVRGKNKLFLE